MDTYVTELEVLEYINRRIGGVSTNIKDIIMK